MVKLAENHPIVPRALPENLPAGQGFMRCESHHIPMIYDEDGEWVCAIEYLMGCLEESALVAFQFEPLPDEDDELTLSLVFDDGQKLKLPAPHGRSFEVDLRMANHSLPFNGEIVTRRGLHYAFAIK